MADRCGTGSSASGRMELLTVKEASEGRNGLFRASERAFPVCDMVCLVVRNGLSGGMKEPLPQGTEGFVCGRKSANG